MSRFIQITISIKIINIQLHKNFYVKINHYYPIRSQILNYTIDINHSIQCKLEYTIISITWTLWFHNKHDCNTHLYSSKKTIKLIWKSCFLICSINKTSGKHERKHTHISQYYSQMYKLINSRFLFTPSALNVSSTGKKGSA